jgi:hypothetical protein
MWGLVWVHVGEGARPEAAIDRHMALARRCGATAEYVYRATDPRDLLLAVRFPDRAPAEAFLADPELMACLREAGMDRAPSFAVAEVVRPLVGA